MSTADIELILRLLNAESSRDMEAIGQSFPREREAMNNLFAWMRRHRIEPAIRLNVRRFGAKHLPRRVPKYLRRVAEHDAARAVANASELLTIVRAFETARVPAIVVGGVALSQAIYADLAARRVEDLIDLLVAPSELERARQLARQHRTDKQIRVRVHPRLFNDPLLMAVPFEQLHARVVQTQIGDSAVPTLHPTDQFIYLCLFGTRHQWERLGWLYDIHRLTLTGLDWDAIGKAAHELGVERSIGEALVMAARLLGSKIPAPWQWAMADQSIDQRVTAARMSLAARRQRPTRIERVKSSLRTLMARVPLVSRFRQMLASSENP